MDKIAVSIDDRTLFVIGNGFWEMLGQVKSIPGRTMGAQKVWELPLSLDDARAHVSPLQIVDEDGLLDAEIADIQRVQAQILSMKLAIEARIEILSGEVSRYSRRSKSSIKAGVARTSACLSHALDYAAMPIEILAEPQIKTLYAALRCMEEE